MTTPPPWVSGPLVGFDLETSGVNVFEDRIVTATVVSVLPGKRPFFHRWLINPGVAIPAEATAIHGISTERAATEGVEPGRALFEIGAQLGMGLRNRVPLIAFNAAFDLSMFEAECVRHQVPSLTERLTHKRIAPIVDPFVIDRGIDKYRKGSRRLADQCTHYGVTLAGAHNSDADALAAVRLAVVIASRKVEVSRMTLQQLHARQVTWHKERQESFVNYLRREGKDASDVSGEWPIRVSPVREEVSA